MKSKLAQLLGVAAAFLCLASTPTQAANINTGGSACQSEVSNDPNVVIDLFGIVNQSSTASAFITCTIPRSPLAAGATSALFYVDGEIVQAGGTISCFLWSTNFTGDLLGSTSFQFTVNTDTKFDQLLILPAAQVSIWAYTQLFCSLPPASHILGVTSVQ